MKKLKIEYKGGYNQVSNYLIREHDASFAVIVDALVNIYNMNIDKLVKIGGENSVEVSNGFLSRNTGLSLDVIKRNVEKIEEIGLVIAIKKGKGNTRHYVIHIEEINTYIKALKGKFDQWYNESRESSKKDIARSKEADKIKIEASFKKFEKTMEMITIPTRKPPIRLVQNPPTKTDKTHQPKRIKPPVADINKETTIKTTTNKNNVVLDSIFDQKNPEGAYTYIKEYDRTINKKTYEEYIVNLTKENLEQKFDEFKQQEFDDSLVIEDVFDLDDNDKNDVTEDEMKHPITNDRTMMHIYNQAQKLESKKLRLAKREYETTKKSASPETSETNWKRLKTAYDDLPPVKNQGQFFTSKKNKEDFFQLSGFRQEWVIKEVVQKKNKATTASRPATYIGKAMKDKLRVLKTQNNRLNVAL